MGTFAVFAIKPSTENITNPDNRHVPSLKQANISVSLKETHKSK
jgi:hypothetical protein